MWNIQEHVPTNRSTYEIRKNIDDNKQRFNIRMWSSIRIIGWKFDKNKL